MFADSVIGKLVHWFIGLFASYKYSVCYRAVSSVCTKIRRLYNYSFLGKILSEKNPKRDRYFQNSFLFRTADKLIDSLNGLFSRIYKFIRQKNTDGLNVRLYNLFAPAIKFEYLLAGVLAIMFCIPHDYWNNAYGLILAFGFVFLYMCAKASGREFSIKIRDFDVTLVLFIVMVFCGVLTSTSVSDSVRVLLFFVTSFAFMFCVAGSLNTQESIMSFLKIMYVAVFVTSLVAIWQRIVGVPVDPSLTDISMNQDMPGRVFSTMANPNNYAEFLILFVPLMFVMAVNLKNKMLKTGLITLLIFPVLAFLMTYSRSGWVSFALVVFIAIFLYNKKYIPALILLAIAAVPFLPSSILNRILTIGNMSDSSNSYRIYIWKAVLKMMRERWFFGVGLGPESFHSFYARFANPKAAIAMHSHMLYLETWVETGLVGVVSFLWFYLSMARRCVVAKRQATPEMKNILIACAATALGMLFICGVEYVWYYPRIMFAFWIFAGICIASCRVAQNQTDNSIK